MSRETSFVLVPGAWHSPAAFDSLANILRTRGFGAHGVTLPSVGSSSPRKQVGDDADSIRAAIEEEVEAGKDVVMVFHSYGSIPASEALSHFKDPTTGKGRVKRIVYMCSFVLPEGGSLMRALGMKDLPWFRVEGDIVMPENTAHVFYNDVPESEVQSYVDAIQPHSYRTLYHEQSFAPWKHFPSTYIICEQDNAIPLQAQEGMISAAKAACPTSFDMVERCSASHSPFLSMPEKVADFLVKAASG